MHYVGSNPALKRVEEALVKYSTVNDAVNQIRKFNLEGKKFENSWNQNSRKIVDEFDLENHLAI